MLDREAEEEEEEEEQVAQENAVKVVKEELMNMIVTLVQRKGVQAIMPK